MSKRPITAQLLRIGFVVLIAARVGPGPTRLIAATNAHGPATIVVTTVAELEAALSPGNEGKRILVRAGEYVVSHGLTVPDNATLDGESVMRFDDAGLPAGLDPSGRTVLRSAPELVGDILTLGDGSALRALGVEDVEGRAGNVVSVPSRSPADFVSARINECELVNPNPLGVSLPGPIGHALVVLTRNPNLGFDPPPHEGAVLRVEMKRSIVRSPGTGSGVFAINFASHGAIDLDLSSNVIGGGLDAAGGVSRPDAVTGAGVNIRSRQNLYRSDGPTPTELGWRVIGGTTAPIPGLVSEASTSNSVRLHSTDDRIEGFEVGVTAIGGWRTAPLPERSDSNTIELNLTGTFLQTVEADLSLTGALSLVDGVSAGDRNVVALNIRQATGSGPRANLYADGFNPGGGDAGVGNRLRVVGDPNAFGRTNDGIVPPPPAEFFKAQR